MLDAVRAAASTVVECAFASDNAPWIEQVAALAGMQVSMTGASSVATVAGAFPISFRILAL